MPTDIRSCWDRHSRTNKQVAFGRAIFQMKKQHETIDTFHTYIGILHHFVFGVTLSATNNNSSERENEER